LKSSSDPLNLKVHVDMMKYPLIYIKSIQLIAYKTFIKGDRMDVSNYRPIHILTSCSKILEKGTYNRLLAHVINNNILA
jgi:hypothetical protein